MRWSCEASWTNQVRTGPTGNAAGPRSLHSVCQPWDILRSEGTAGIARCTVGVPWLWLSPVRCRLPVTSNPPLLCQGMQDVPLSVGIVQLPLLGQGGGRRHSGEVLPVVVRWASFVLCRGAEDTQGEGEREGAAGLIS